MINFIRQSALVLILSVIFGSALALIYAWTNPMYVENQEAATVISIAKTIPGAQTAQNLQTTEVKSITDFKVYKVTGQIPGGKKGLLGWAYVAKGKGFGGDIKLLIGLGPKAKTIVGLDVLEDVETPGFGHSINDEAQWKSKFRPHEGKVLPLDKPLVVIKKEPNADNPYQIQAITGATISSKAVVAVINESAGKVAAQIRQKD